MKNIALVHKLCSKDMMQNMEPCMYLLRLAQSPLSAYIRYFFSVGVSGAPGTVGSGGTWHCNSGVLSSTKCSCDSVTCISLLSNPVALEMKLFF
jgi:hypothetical protein